MEQAGITSSTKSPAGGEILKDNSGKIVGVFSENAMGLVGTAYNAWEDNKVKKYELQNGHIASSLQKKIV
jgi:predicted amidohydrolase YtcJ